MAQKFALTVQGLSKLYPPNKWILKDLSLSFFLGAKIGVLGLNGAGKSTLLKILAGIETQFQGEVSLSDGISVGYLPQEPLLDPDKTVEECVQEGLGEVTQWIKRFEEISHAFSDPQLEPDLMEKLLAEQAEVQEKIDHVQGWEVDRSVRLAMEALRLPPGHSKVRPLSGGEKRRVALCRLLLQKPDVLLLDEPTNHLDAESVAWLEQYLQSYAGTVIAVTHDRYFLDHIASWILELDRGQGIPWHGNYSSWLEQKQKRLLQEERQEVRRQRTLERELEWIRLSPKARQAKNKARIQSYEKLAAQEQSERLEDVEIYIPPGPRLGDRVIQVQGLSKTFGEKILFQDLSFQIPRGSIVGIIGGNGLGKTTLFRLFTGQENPDEGHIHWGETVQLAYVDQSRESLSDENTVWEEISEGKNEILLLGNKEVSSRSYCARFHFVGSDQQKKVHALSGGERNRVHLAKVLKQGGNVLLLDEPTNDLDVNTLRALEDALVRFSGCALVISHDRWFLDRICTHLLSFEGNGQVRFFEGNYHDFEEFKKIKQNA